jgi:hypothetical protein
MLDREYQVVTVEQTPSPVAGDQGRWYRYIIEGGYAPIIGQRKGTKQQIIKYCEHLAAELNERKKTGVSSGVSRAKKP